MGNQRDELVRQMIIEGESYAAVGARVGLTRERVRQIAKQLGIRAITSWADTAERRRARIAALFAKPGSGANSPSKRGLQLRRLRELLHYDRYTGIWRWQRTGRLAGTTHVGGYIQIRVDGRLYMAHVLAWLYCFEQWPANEIDHINRNRADNRLDNLRQATRSQNIGNSPKRRTNKSGHKGVWFDQSKGRWIAEIAHVKLGSFLTAAEAADAYQRAAESYFGNHAYKGA